MKWLAILITLAACSSTPTTKPEEPTPLEHGPEHGVSEAPVGIDAKIDKGVAHVEIAFQEAGSGVVMSARGVGGLVVTSQEVVAVDLAVAAGQLMSFDVAFDPAATPSVLSVEVRGTFGGREQVKVRTFEVSGTKPAPTVDDTTKLIDGERAKVTPATEAP